MSSGGEIPEPEFFGDLHLDQIVRGMTAGREEYRLTPYFYQPLSNPEAIYFRQQIFQDLEDTPLREGLKGFGKNLQQVYRFLPKTISTDRGGGGKEKKGFFRGLQPLPEYHPEW